MKNILSIGAGLLIAGLAIGWKFHQKGENRGETKAYLITLCGADQECVQAVNQYGDECHDSAYTMGGRHRAASMNNDALARCLNQKSGKPLFSTSTP